MFFAITALVVSAVQIVIGVAIGLSLSRHRRRQAAEEPPPKPRGRLAASAKRSNARSANAPPAADEPPTNDPRETPDSMAERGNRRTKPAPRQLEETLPAKRPPGDSHAADGKRPPSAREPAAPRNARAEPAEDKVPFAEAPQSADRPSGRDRRVSTRRSFDYRQFVAPYNGGSLPGKASFREVECQDISSTGFSFLSSQVPDFDSLVVALGVAPYLTYVQAQIVNRFQIEDGPAPLYRIGCRFAGQVN